MDRIELPGDRARPAIRNPVWRRIEGRAVGEDLARFAVLIGKLANTVDFVIGCSDGTAIVVHLDPDETLEALAARLATAGSVSVPFESAPDPARHPAFDVGYGAGEPLGDLHLDASGALAYDAQLFSAERADRIARAFAEVSRAAPSTPVGRIALLGDAEAAELLAELSTPSFNWPKHHTLHELFEAKCELAPSATALVCGDERVSYGELDERANSLAHDLVTIGVGPDAIVALVQDRSIEMIVAILGVLKAGGAYLPIEPDAPPDRLRYLLEDSGAVAVVTTAAFAGSITHPHVVTVGAYQPKPTLSRRAEPHHLAYVIYTSGSTGQPKGVLVEHRNVVHLVLAEKNDFAIRAKDALILLSSYSFDASIDQIWLALSSGAKLVIVPKSTLIDPAQLARVIVNEGITHLDSVPALLAELSPMLPSIRQVVVGGETCPVAIAVLERIRTDRDHGRIAASARGSIGCRRRPRADRPSDRDDPRVHPRLGWVPGADRGARRALPRRCRRRARLPSSRRAKAAGCIAPAIWSRGCRTAASSFSVASIARSRFAGFVSSSARAKRLSCAIPRSRARPRACSARIDSCVTSSRTSRFRPPSCARFSRGHCRRT